MYKVIWMAAADGELGVETLSGWEQSGQMQKFMYVVVVHG